jgi:hypothetical protein
LKEEEEEEQAQEPEEEDEELKALKDGTRLHVNNNQLCTSTTSSCSVVEVFALFKTNIWLRTAVKVFRHYLIA